MTRWPSVIGSIELFDGTKVSRLARVFGPFGTELSHATPGSRFPVVTRVFGPFGTEVSYATAGSCSPVVTGGLDFISQLSCDVVVEVGFVVPQMMPPIR